MILVDNTPLHLYWDGNDTPVKLKAVYESFYQHRGEMNEVNAQVQRSNGMLRVRVRACVLFMLESDMPEGKNTFE